jgi:hypothetical protein
MKIIITNPDLFSEKVDVITRREKSLIVNLQNEDVIVFRYPFKKTDGNKFGFQIQTIEKEISSEIVAKKEIKKRKVTEKKKRNFSERQLEHQQKFARKMKDFWASNKEKEQ